MPKQRITREMIIDAAFALAREEGMEAVLLKTVAQRLGCSVQPVYSHYKNMQELRREVSCRAHAFAQSYLAAHAQPGDLFFSTGRACLQLAREEPQLFKLFILHQRQGVGSLLQLYEAETDPQVKKQIAKGFDISEGRARQLHLDLLIYNIGLGAIFAVTDPGVPAEEIFSRQENAYQAFLAQALKEKEAAHEE